MITCAKLLHWGPGQKTKIRPFKTLRNSEIRSASQFHVLFLNLCVFVCDYFLPVNKLHPSCLCLLPPPAAAGGGYLRLAECKHVYPHKGTHEVSASLPHYRVFHTCPTTKTTTKTTTTTTTTETFLANAVTTYVGFQSLISGILLSSPRV